MLNERRCPVSEERQFFLYQFLVIINTFRPIPSNIIPNAAENIVCRTSENNERVNISDLRNVLCLTNMPRDAVQDKNVALRESHPVQKQREDLFCQGEVLVFKQEATLKNAMDELELRRRVSSRPYFARYDIAKFRSEIEVMALTSEQAVVRQSITERALPDPGWAEEKDGVNRVCVKNFHNDWVKRHGARS